MAIGHGVSDHCTWGVLLKLFDQKSTNCHWIWWHHNLVLWTARLFKLYFPPKHSLPFLKHSSSSICLASNFGFAFVFSLSLGCSFSFPDTVCSFHASPVNFPCVDQSAVGEGGEWNSGSSEGCSCSHYSLQWPWNVSGLLAFYNQHPFKTCQSRNNHQLLNWWKKYVPLGVILDPSWSLLTALMFLFTSHLKSALTVSLIQRLLKNTYALT